MAVILPGVGETLMEYGAFMDQCETHEENLHRLLGIGVAEAVQYQELIFKFSARKKEGLSPGEIQCEADINTLLFGAWFALYKRKKR